MCAIFGSSRLSIMAKRGRKSAEAGQIKRLGDEAVAFSFGNPRFSNVSLNF
jgi:hypothetical protein